MLYAAGKRMAMHTMLMAVIKTQLSLINCRRQRPFIVHVLKHNHEN